MDADVFASESQIRRDASGLTDFMPSDRVKLDSDDDVDHILDKHRREYRAEMAKTRPAVQTWYHSLCLLLFLVLVIVILLIDFMVYLFI